MCPDVRTAVAVEESRIARPDYLLPSQIGEGVGECLALESGPYSEWFQIAMCELEQAASDSYITPAPMPIHRASAVVLGITRNARLEGLPFGRGNGESWWELNPAPHVGARLSPSLEGPLCGLSFGKDYLGHWSVLEFHPTIVSLLGLRPTRWPGPLRLLDHEERPAAVYRCWWTKAHGDDLRKQVPTWAGCELLLRQDLWQRLRDMCLMEPLLVTRVWQETSS